MQLVSLDFLCHRYGIIPSQAIKQCDTFDLLVLDIGAKWNNRQNTDGAEPEKKELTQEEMLAMIKNVREQNAKKEG